MAEARVISFQRAPVSFRVGCRTTPEQDRKMYLAMRPMWEQQLADAWREQREETREMTTADDMSKLFQDAGERRRDEMVSALCTSCASFIAEIDSSSSDVAAYLEQRLGALLRIAYQNGGVRALELAMQDARKLSRR